jgi:hypothetical protein
MINSNGTIVYLNEPSNRISQLIIPVGEFKNGIYYLFVAGGKTTQKELIIKH